MKPSICENRVFPKRLKPTEMLYKIPFRLRVASGCEELKSLSVLKFDARVYNWGECASVRATWAWDWWVTWAHFYGGFAGGLIMEAVLARFYKKRSGPGPSRRSDFPHPARSKFQGCSGRWRALFGWVSSKTAHFWTLKIDSRDKIDPRVEPPWLGARPICAELFTHAKPEEKGW